MQSKAKDVPAYINEAPVERQAVLTRLRELCRAELTGFEETMDCSCRRGRRHEFVSPAPCALRGAGSFDNSL